MGSITTHAWQRFRVMFSPIDRYNKHQTIPNHTVWYCWWKKSCAWDVKDLVNNGINYISTGAWFLPSTVSLFGEFNMHVTNLEVSLTAINEEKYLSTFGESLYHVRMRRSGCPRETTCGHMTSPLLKWTRSSFCSKPLENLNLVFGHPLHSPTDHYYLPNISQP